MTSSLDDVMSNANLAYGEGRFSDSMSFCDTILQQLPDNVPALVLRGIATMKGGEPAASLASFERAIAIDAKCGPAFHWLSIAHQRIGNKPEALANARKAVWLNSMDPVVQHHLGQCLLETGDFIAAASTLEKAASMAPNVARPHYTLGLAFQGLKRNLDAIRAFRRAIRLDPSFIEAFVALRHSLMDELDTAAALEIARAILRLRPDSSEANLWLAQSLLEDNKAAEADPYIKRAVELDPNTGEGHSILGSILQVSGDLASANQHFRQSIELLPRQGAAYLALTTNNKVKEDDRPLVQQMESLVGDPTLPAIERSQLDYALGKAYEDLGEYANAMRHLDEANRLAYSIKYGEHSYDRKAAQGRLEQTISRYDSEFFERNKGAGVSSDIPIFVVGMIRSGTTLAEQILSCHPLVGAAGEQSFWLENANAFSGRDKTLDAALLGKFSKRYLDLLQSIDSGKEHVVDKMPMNYMVMGLLHVAFPRAKFLHIQRHPIDTCLSIYATPNRSRLEWAHDKGNIAFNYTQYLRLMDHWRTVLPSGTMLDVPYENMVAEFETTARAMVDFCGLEWDDACLRPQDNKRSVVTPSVWQVRQPIYKTSLARWKKYEGLLGQLEALNK